MSSRGSLAKNGHVGTNEYDIVEILQSGAEVLKGKGKNHSLPDYSHTPNRVYVKKEHDGSFREMRFYGDDHKVFLEIGYHGEASLNSDTRIKEWHYHLYDKNLTHSKASFLSKDLVSKYWKYLEDVGYDKR